MGIPVQNVWNTYVYYFYDVPLYQEKCSFYDFIVAGKTSTGNYINIAEFTPRKKIKVKDERISA